jgi:hypothetical protein
VLGGVRHAAHFVGANHLETANGQRGSRHHRAINVAPIDWEAAFWRLFLD